MPFSGPTMYPVKTVLTGVAHSDAVRGGRVGQTYLGVGHRHPAENWAVLRLRLEPDRSGRTPKPATLSSLVSPQAHDNDEHHSTKCVSPQDVADPVGAQVYPGNPDGHQPQHEACADKRSGDTRLHVLS